MGWKFGSYEAEVSPRDVEVEPGKRVTVTVEVPGTTFVDVILDEKVVDEIVRQWLDLPPGTTRGELIDGVLEGYERSGGGDEES